MMAARREGLAPAGVPQTDPVAAAMAAEAAVTPPGGPRAAPTEPPASRAAPSAGAVPAARRPSLPHTPARVVPAPAAPAAPSPAPPAAAGPSLGTLSAVKRDEMLRQVGYHMYPSRHRQLTELAFLENR